MFVTKKLFVLLVVLVATCTAESPLRSRELTICATLQGCYLVNIKTGAEILLDGFDSFEFDPTNEKGYSIRCDITSTGRLSNIKFFYDGLTQIESASPYYMFGDSAAGSIINKVDYLSTCGRKEVSIVGSLSSRTCFEKKFKINASNPRGVRCDDTPVSPPVSAPIKAPAAAPLSVPVQAPVKRPVAVPLPAPFQAPVKQPVAPVTPPASAPVSAPSNGSCRARITGFTLVDANLGSDIMPLGNFDVNEVPARLNIRADVAACTPKVVESVLLDFDGVTRCERFTPYTSFGDSSKSDLSNEEASYNGRAISVGTHIIKATPYSGDKCTGTAGPTRTKTFVVKRSPPPAPVALPVKAPVQRPVAPVAPPTNAPVSAPSNGSCRAEVTGFTLVDANLGSDVMPLGNFVVNEVPALLNIRADVAACTPKVVDSVLLDLDGVTRCERFTPYTSFGDSSRSDLSNDAASYNGRAISIGSHVIKATPYTGDKCTGTAGSTLTLTFTVSPPVAVPVRAPVRPPIRGPVRPPVKPPVGEDKRPTAAPYNDDYYDDDYY